MFVVDEIQEIHREKETRPNLTEDLEMIISTDEGETNEIDDIPTDPMEPILATTSVPAEDITLKESVAPTNESDRDLVPWKDEVVPTATIRNGYFPPRSKTKHH